MWTEHPDFYRRFCVIFVGLAVAACQSHAEILRCCSFASGSCRSLCEKLSLVGMASDSEEHEKNMHKLNDLCHNHYMNPFWNCINETLNEVDKGKGWVGRPCCRLPQSEKCKMACLKAQSILDLSSCRKSDEIAFFGCIERQETGERCCRNAHTEKCKAACKEVFVRSFTPNKEIREAVNKHCSLDNPRIQQCVHSYVQVTPADHPMRNLHCCDQSLNIQCRIECKNILQTETTTQEITDGLSMSVCGPPLPQDRMWQCFLMNAANGDTGGTLIQSENIGMDSAKLQCCFRAATLNCQRLCIEIFNNEWITKENDFGRLCQNQLAESEMIRCLAEVDEPCELGCKNLSYCTNFNSRSTELFRNCDPSADTSAKLDVSTWEDGLIRLPVLKMQIPLLRISECYFQLRKAIACALHVKPCHHKAHVNMICKSDCMDILDKCVDQSRLLGNQNPASICEVLSAPENDTPCISLAPYLVPSDHAETSVEVTHPCSPDPCEKKDICMVDRNCVIGQKCKKHVCVKGCRMGYISQLTVPQNTHVRVPSNTRGPRCHMVCKCNNENELEDCVTQNCFGTGHCWHEGNKHNHNTWFKMDCKTCFCYDGEITCTPNDCDSSLPCACQFHYVPVCGANGKTYPSACLARCAGLTDDQFEFGACYDSDPCSPNSCHPYHRCVPKKRVCLSIRHRSCKQYDCVNMQHHCNEQTKAPVCDTDNVEHPNICWMLQRRKFLAYYGKCMPHCRANGLVCGHNGETYASECAAWAERVSVDYKGTCAAVGSKYGKNSRCSGIRCAPLPSEHCTKVFPPGGCCPICGAALRLLYSQKLSDWSVEAAREVDPVVIQTIAEKLREHVKIAECEVFAYLSLDSDIIVLVIAITDSPTKLQVEACRKEAGKLQALIEQHSPTLLTELPLSFFTTAILLEPVTDSTTHLTINIWILLIAIVFSWILQRFY